MTKKEKKEEALHLKAALDAKHARLNPKPALDKEKIEKYHKNRYGPKKRRSKDDEMYWLTRKKYYD